MRFFTIVSVVAVTLLSITQATPVPSSLASASGSHSVQASASASKSFHVSASVAPSMRASASAVEASDSGLPHQIVKQEDKKENGKWDGQKHGHGFNWGNQHP